MKYSDDEYYHLYNRGAHKSAIFYSSENYRYLLHLMDTNSKRFNVSILAYCLMPNHYHILVRQEGDGAISKFVKATFSAYTQALNNQQGFSGSLFQGKTQARHVDSDDYVLQVIRYIHLNPVEARLAAKPEDWEFSDYRDWIKHKDIPEIACEKTERTYSRFYELRQAFFVDGEDYRQFVAEYQQERDISKIEKYLYDE